MSGSKTVLGFTGNSPAAAPNAGADSDEPRLSRTIIGHDLHRPTGQVELRKSNPLPAAASDPGPQPTSPGTPSRPSASSAVVTQAVDEITEQLPDRRRPSHSGKTGFPAFARLFGRWTTGGTFRRRSSLDAEADDDLAVPRDPWVQRIVILLGATLFSFLVALAAVKLHQCVTSDGRPASGSGPAATAPAAPAPRPAPAPVTAVPTPAPAAPATVPVPAAVPTADRPNDPPPARAAQPAPAPVAERPAPRLGHFAAPSPASRGRKATVAPSGSTPAPSASPAPQADPDSLLPLTM